MHKNILQKLYPQIAKDWDVKKNGNLMPTDLAATSKKKVWWKCDNKHTYEVSIYSRVRSKGCKFCNQSKHSEKVRSAKLKNSISLAEKNPLLLSDWDYTKNFKIDPHAISYGSNIKVWWKCSKGHSWQSSPKSRNRGNGCPTCTHKGIGKRVRQFAIKRAGKSFSDAYPHLLKEWDFDKNKLKPTEIPPKSNYRASWRCQYGHEWEATVTNRTHNESNCPECNPQSSRLEIYLLCELRAIFDYVQWRHKFKGVECDIFIPEINLGIEVDGQYWHQSKLEKDQNKDQFFKNLGLQIIRVRDSDLPDIEGNIVKFDRKSKPQDIVNILVREIRNFHHILAIDRYLVEGFQKSGNAYNEMISRLPAPPSGETLEDTHPVIAKEWDYDVNLPLTPSLFSKGSDQKFGWSCEYGHKWDATIKNRTLRKSGCPTCYANNASDIARKGRNKNTQTLEQANTVYLDMYDLEKNRLPPSEVALKSSMQIWWRCKNGHIFKKKPIDMFKNHDCPTCNSLPFKYPQIAAEWDYEKNKTEKPEDFHYGSKKKVWWKCYKGHSWKTAITFRTGKDRTGCPHCYNDNRGDIYRQKSAERNGSLKDANPEYLIEWDYEKNGDLTPENFTAKSALKVWWKCSNNHSYEQSIASKARGSICPECAKITRAENARLGRLKRTGSLQDNFSDIAALWHPSKNGDLLPSEISSGSKYVAWWQCINNHEWHISVNSMTGKRRSYICPVCKNKWSNGVGS